MLRWCFLACLSCAAHAEECKFSTEPVVTDLGSGYKYWVWSEPYQSSLFSDGLWYDNSAYTTYASWLNETIPARFDGLDPFDQRACLEHQRAIFARVGYNPHNFDVILNGTVHGLYQMNCIESLLWAKQNAEYSLMGDGREFGAYILVDDRKTTVKIYLQTGPAMGVAIKFSLAPINTDLRNGFKMLTFLHLHPFFPNNKYGDCAGTCIPSNPDLGFFAGVKRTYSCQEAWITNGADSLRFPLSELGLFGTTLSSGMREVYNGEPTQQFV